MRHDHEAGESLPAETLDELAETIRREHDAALGDRVRAIGHELAIGRGVNAARVECRNANIAYGRWFRETKLPFGTEWARQLGRLATHEPFVRTWWLHELDEGREPSTRRAYAALQHHLKPPEADRRSFASALANENEFPQSERRARIETTLAVTWARGNRKSAFSNADERLHRDWEAEQHEGMLDVLATHAPDDYDADDLEHVLDELLEVLRGE